jgi:hypothetical protein
VKLIRTSRGRYTFQMERKEKQLLFKLLEMYPLIPASHQSLSKSEEQPENQQLLDEALAEQRRENKEQVKAMLAGGTVFQANDEGYLFSLRTAGMDWLLQVLNDVRVGSWLVLGAPDDPAKMFAKLNEQTAPFFWACEISGHFQMVLIRAMSGDRGDVKE